MVNPISAQQVRPLGPIAPATAAQPVAKEGEGGFAGSLRAQLEKVSAMQTEADRGVENLLTGQTENVTEVFATARKAEVAFSLLMEIRNKLTDAYTELKRIET